MCPVPLRQRRTYADHTNTLDPISGTVLTFNIELYNHAQVRGFGIQFKSLKFIIIYGKRLTVCINRYVQLMLNY